jgi:hypothetical protein
VGELLGELVGKLGSWLGSQMGALLGAEGAVVDSEKGATVGAWEETGVGTEVNGDCEMKITVGTPVGK